MKIKQAAFIAVDTASKPPHMCVWTVCGSAGQVRAKIGNVWDSSDPKGGWKAARIEGMRVLKINLCGDLQ